MEKEKDPETYEALGGDDMETWVNKVLDTHRSMSLKGKRIRSDVGMQNVFKKSHFKQSENGIYSKPKIFRPETKARQLWTGKGLYEGMFKPRNLDSRLDVWNKQQPEKDGVKINQYNETGQPDGYWDNWIDDDNMVSGKGFFIKGLKHGMWEEYLLDELIGKGIYKNGKESGIWELYCDGKLDFKILFDNGKVIGKWQISKDNLGESNNLFKPRNIKSRYDKWNSEQPIVDGKPINQYDSEGKKTGLWKEINGKFYGIYNYVNDERDGESNIYNNKGLLITKGQYVDGIRYGLWVFYKKEGDDKDFTCLYDNGKIKQINGRIRK